MPEDDDDWTSIVTPTVPVARLRVEAHDLFDPIWKSGKVKRRKAYFLLANAMNVPEPEAHFKQMDREALTKAFPAIRRLRLRFGLPV